MHYILFWFLSSENAEAILFSYPKDTLKSFGDFAKKKNEFRPQFILL